MADKSNPFASLANKLDGRRKTEDGTESTKATKPIKSLVTITPLNLNKPKPKPNLESDEIKIMPSLEAIGNLIGTEKPAKSETQVTDKFTHTDQTTSEAMQYQTDELNTMLNILNQALASAEPSTNLYDIMTYLQDNPKLVDNMLPEGIAVMVRSLGRSYKAAVKSATKRKASRKTSTARQAEVANELADLGFDL